MSRHDFGLNLLLQRATILGRMPRGPFLRRSKLG